MTELVYTARGKAIPAINRKATLMNDKVNYRSEVKTHRHPPTLQTQKSHSFGVKDAKERELGTIVTTYREEFTPLTDPNPRSWSTIEPGHWFGVSVHTTRDGKTFGACGNGALLRSEAGRDAYIKKYLADAKKRALKNEGK